MTPEHTAHVETLAHVNRGECDGYWGLSDVTEGELADVERSRRHCGHRNRIGEFARGA